MRPPLSPAPRFHPCSVRLGRGCYIPASPTNREPVWQEPTSVITTHTGCRIVVTGNQSAMVTSSGDFDVTDCVPDPVKRDQEHTSIVEFWQAESLRWAREALDLVRELQARASDMFEIDGQQATAPGFDSVEQFMDFVERAKSSQLRTYPGPSPKTVMVQSSSSDTHYTVTRDHCDCYGGRTHGRCFHRALVIWLYDVQGVDVTKVPTIGVSKRGVPLTLGRKPAAKGAA